jgi:RNA polymerase sigma-70 factor (ECF subfamily)
MKDTDIITLYNQRDERAIYETHRKYGDYCMSISLGILHNHQDAEECVNDTYLHTWKSIPPKQPSVLRTYLGKLTRNISIDRLRTRRRARRDSELTVSFEELADILAATEDTNEGELTDLLNNFLDALPDTERRLFVGRYWYAYPVNQMAEAYGMTPNAVSKQLGRTREKLKAYLEERGYTV